MTTKHTDEQIAAAFELAESVRRTPALIPMAWKDLADKATAPAVGPLATKAAVRCVEQEQNSDHYASTIQDTCQPDELRRCLAWASLNADWYSLVGGVGSNEILEATRAVLAKTEVK